ncbi:hypothetical protein [Alkalispirochaeta americana]|uniref:hypothetical protein n=1 Tax=Alkalispirochaeta americana TaxID=159291 RepID=UPI00117A17C7|nr:hypothetical protein [Alkalispirochaeta americana]
MTQVNLRMTKAMKDEIDRFAKLTGESSQKIMRYMLMTGINSLRLDLIENPRQAVTTIRYYDKVLALHEAGEHGLPDAFDETAKNRFLDLQDEIERQLRNSDSE